jgi:hypothetical protein
MDYTEYTAVKNKFSSTPNLCDLFKLLSIETWKRIEYAYLRPGIKVFETTITQNLIFTINAYNEQFGLNIEISEAKDEKTNGNDFELIIRFPGEGIEFYSPIQAKKVYRDGKYSSMDHGAQIQSLMDFADAQDAKPFYLLYNFATSPLRTGSNLSMPKELSGCTLASAEYLYNNHYNKRVKKDGTTTWRIPHFYDLNPSHAFAWHELVCPNSAKELHETLQNNGIATRIDFQNPNSLLSLPKDLKQGFYPLNTFKMDINWISIKDMNVEDTDLEMEKKESFTRLEGQMFKEIGENIDKPKNAIEREKVYPVFSPKSRIILSK